MTNGLV
jgi:hypothetical protein